MKTYLPLPRCFASPLFYGAGLAALDTDLLMIEEYLKDKIIIAEDDPITELLLKSTLEKWGFDPTDVQDGQEALKLLRTAEEPRIVLLDWLMPGMDGIDIVKELRREEKENPHYVIMLTSKNEKKDVILALEAGADDFLSKPFDTDELKARIKAGLRLVGLHIQLKRAIKSANKLADFIAHYDQTTGLPNRVLFTERIDELVNNGQSAALILVNIDRFKRINQAKGLDLGDLLLNYFGARLQECFEEEAVVARIAADEFGVLIPFDGGCVYTTDEIINFLYAKAQRIHARMAERFPIDEGVNITVSIGAAPVTCEIALEPEEFLRRVDTALRKAKALGGNQTVIHDRKMEEEVRQRYDMEKDLAEGLDNGDLRLFLQAQVRPDGSFHGAEALVRWMHPKKGMISPGLFIPVAEESDLVLRIGRWVLNEVCELLCKYSREDFTLSVNISPKQFAREDFVDEILSAVSEKSVSPDRIILEVTEGLLINDMDEVAKKMIRLSRAGFRFSIDDFGTGYSSLSYLKSLPISEIKIDRTFVKGLPGDEDSRAIVKAIFLMAEALGMEVVAEGIESEGQAMFLSKAGNVIYQGFLFSKPAPAGDAIEHWLHKDK